MGKEDHDFKVDHFDSDVGHKYLGWEETITVALWLHFFRDGKISGEKFIRWNIPITKGRNLDRISWLHSFEM